MASGIASKGSQRWLQIAVNRRRDVINRKIAYALNLPDGEEIKWLSPLESDSFLEYRDSAFLEKLGITLTQTPLNEFWPPARPCVGRLGSNEQQS